MDTMQRLNNLSTKIAVGVEEGDFLIDFLTKAMKNYFILAFEHLKKIADRKIYKNWSFSESTYTFEIECLVDLEDFGIKKIHKMYILFDTEPNSQRGKAFVTGKFWMSDYDIQMVKDNFNDRDPKAFAFELNDMTNSYIEEQIS
jgi:hypothetical protein